MKLSEKMGNMLLKGKNNMDDKIFYKNLLSIMLAHREMEAIEYLLSVMRNRINEQQKQLDESKAIIQTIKKINKGKNKDIDTLCNEELTAQ